jgi:nicotinate-nucleotide pyrophosphorylase (carboxylating)
MTKIEKLHDSSVSRIIEQALFEDLGFGDLSTESIIPKGKLATAHIVSSDNGIIAGLKVAGLVYRYTDMQITFSPLISDGDVLTSGQTVAHIHGPLRGILQGKQTTLNFIMRMSGIASVTHKYVNKVKGTGAKIVGTRYTIPNFRMFDHLAFNAGGGVVRSFGSDQEIIVNNDFTPAVGGISQAIKKAFNYTKNFEHPVSVEVRTFDELRDVLHYAGRLQRIILAGFPPQVLPQAIEMIGNQTEIEVTGNVSLGNIREIAEAGVHYISIPEATHSPQAISFTFLIS